MTKNIECEIIAEISVKEFDQFLKKFKTQGNLIKKTRRLSVMFFGKEIDIRVRTDEHESEIAVKKGELHASDRIEFNQPITKDQFIGMVKAFALFNFNNIKIGERETYYFDFKNQIELALVKAGPIAYVEIEKICQQSNFKSTENKLQKLAGELELNIIDSDGFYELCRQLTKKHDWVFKGTKTHFNKLKKLLKKY